MLSGDPVGNLVYLDDLAQRPTATRVIHGLTVTAERTYRYDARYQLTDATGRVHNALTQPDFRGDVPTSGSFRGTRRVGLNDGGAVSRYQRTYSYDDGGNLTGWAHGLQGMNPGNTWTNEKWVSPTSNRSFPAYDLNGVPVSAPESKFDARGQLTSLPSVRAMEWSVRGQLRRTVLIERAGGIDDDERYDYAADGVRLRKTTRREVDGSTEIAETIYLDGCELRRITRNGTVLLERWSSHASDGDQRIATLYRWETDIQARETDDVALVRTHYHIGTHLGSVALELGGAGEMLSYEEYFPYGRTAFLAGDAVREIKLRTLRFVGKDQDDATGFHVFQYRYYAPFLGNWVSPDPAGEVDGPNRYWYARNSPSTMSDPLGLQANDVPFLQRRANFVVGGSDAGVRALNGNWIYSNRAPSVPPDLSSIGSLTEFGDLGKLPEPQPEQPAQERARPMTPEQRRDAVDRIASAVQRAATGPGTSSSPYSGAGLSADAEQTARLLAGESGSSIPNGPWAGPAGSDHPQPSPPAVDSQAASADTGGAPPDVPDLQRPRSAPPPVAGGDDSGDTHATPASPVRIRIQTADGPLEREFHLSFDPVTAAYQERVWRKSERLHAEDQGRRLGFGRGFGDALTFGLLSRLGEALDTNTPAAWAELAFRITPYGMLYTGGEATIGFLSDPLGAIEQAGQPITDFTRWAFPFISQTHSGSIDTARLYEPDLSAASAEERVRHYTGRGENQGVALGSLTASALGTVVLTPGVRRDRFSSDAGGHLPPNRDVRPELGPDGHQPLMLPANSRTLEEMARRLVEESAQRGRPLTIENALRALRAPVGFEGATARVSGAGIEGHDIRFAFPGEGSTFMRELKALGTRDNPNVQYRAFQARFREGAHQVGRAGEVMIQLPNAAGWDSFVARLSGSLRNRRDRGRFLGVALRVVNESGVQLYYGTPGR